MSKIPWRSEHTSVEKGGDEVWIAEKFQSNSEIAVEESGGGRALNDGGGIEPTKVYQTANAAQMLHRSQTI